MAGWNPDLSCLLPGTTQNLDPTSTKNPAGSAGLALGTGTGTHGVIPIASDLGGGVKAVIQDFYDWINSPFTEPMTPGSVFVLIGVILVGILLWNMILFHVRIAAEAI